MERTTVILPPPPPPSSSHSSSEQHLSRSVHPHHCSLSALASSLDRCQLLVVGLGYIRVVVLASHSWWLSIVVDDAHRTPPRVVVWFTYTPTSEIGELDCVSLHQHIGRSASHYHTAIRAHAVATEHNEAIHCPKEAWVCCAAAVGRSVDRESLLVREGAKRPWLQRLRATRVIPSD